MQTTVAGGVHASHAVHHYRRLAAMSALSFVAMFFLMYAMVDRLSNVFSNLNQAYMAGLMTASMVIVELLVMGSSRGPVPKHCFLAAGGDRLHEGEAGAGRGGLRRPRARRPRSSIDNYDTGARHWSGMSRRSKAFLFVVGASLALPAAARTHGTGNKVMGTVQAVHAEMKHFDVKAADGHTVSIKVTPATKFTRGAATARFHDLETGMRVVVTTRGTGDTRTATLVKLGTTAKAAKSPPPK